MNGKTLLAAGTLALLLLAPPGTAQTRGPSGLPLSTDSEAARSAFMSGMWARDMQQGDEARAHFIRATEADPDFALAHAMLATTANSRGEFERSLAAAERAAAGATRPERIMIEGMRMDADGDQEGALRHALQLTEAAPMSPRAWLSLAGEHADLNQYEEERTAVRKALALAPDMVAAHIRLANSYILSRPLDVDLAERHARVAVALAPEAATPYDILGDVYRQQGELEAARDAYTQAAQYSGDDGSPYQQRGHVNSFLGNYDAARADYDRAIQMSEGNQRASFGVYRALVNVHAGDPEAAVDELTELADRIDAIPGISEPRGLKTFALGEAFRIALHHGMTDRAEAIHRDLSAVWRAMNEASSSDAFARFVGTSIAYNDAMLAIKTGDDAHARAMADRIAELVEPIDNPRKMERVHQVHGALALERGAYADAVRHLRQGNVENSIYTQYMLARALEGAGEAEAAREMYADIAGWNFNSTGLALTRSEAREKMEALAAR